MAVAYLMENEYVKFFIILIGTFLLSEILLFIIRKYVNRITSKTKTDIDDLIIQRITKPLHAIILFIGLYFAVKSLSILENYINIVDKIFFVIFTLMISFILSKILAVLIASWLKVQKKYEKTPQLFTKIITIIIFIIAILIILDHFSIQITPIIAALGLGGLAVGLALQDTFSNFFAGLHIISDQPINVGDYIEMEGDTKGYVDDIGWRSIRIKTLQNNLVIVPNSKLAQGRIVNLSNPGGNSVIVECGVSYNSDLNKVEKVTIDVAKKIQKTIPGALGTFEPFIRYKTFGDSNINFSVILKVEKYVNKHLVTHEFIKALKERYDKEGIEISYPVRKIYQAK
ncbi:mechanosensitive ion channel family protein [Candidatus Woesearchaeota archaeon]|nr:mechanosensitive ion channel family protein [Candidatus Woesearchaeota archaeon]